MIKEIQNILKIIQAGKTAGKVEKYHLMRLLDRDAKPGRVWKDIYPIAIDFGLVEETKNGKWSKITDKGEEFESMIEDISNFTIEQKKFLLKKCILGNRKFPILNQFLINTELVGTDGFEIFYEDSSQLEEISKRELAIISELNLRKNDNNAKKYLISSEFGDILDNYKEGRNEITEPDFDAIQKEQKDVGNKAESFALVYERLILKNRGTGEQIKKFDDLNSKEKIIATRNIRAGYDIESFRNKKSKIEKPDKNIEVKGRKRKTRSFIISSNEVKKGMEYSKRKDREHWIYFYWNIENRKETEIEPTAMIPFQKLNIKLCKDCLKYLVRVDEFI